MDFDAFLETLVSSGIDRITTHMHAKPCPNDAQKSVAEGLIAGMAACRYKSIDEVRAVAEPFKSWHRELARGGKPVEKVPYEDGYERGAHAIIDLVSAWLMLNGQPGIIMPNKDALEVAASMMGVVILSSEPIAITPDIVGLDIQIGMDENGPTLHVEEIRKP